MFNYNSAVSFCTQSATSCDFNPLAPGAATATWLSVQIAICYFTSLFLRQLVTQSSIATISAWKAVTSCPSEVYHCSLLWYLQIPAPVPCWLQAPSVNQTCSSLSQCCQIVFLKICFSEKWKSARNLNTEHKNRYKMVYLSCFLALLQSFPIV